MLIDTHAHLDDKQFDADREEVISRAFSSGVEKIINIGSGLGSSEQSVKLAQKYENIFATVGLHPHYFMKHGTWNMKHKKELEKLAKSPKVVAIGEIGLDYFIPDGWKITPEEKKFQEEGFIYQLELAQKLKLPVVIHCRGELAPAKSHYRESEEAYEDVWKIIGEFTDLKYVFHSFGGRLDFADKALQKKNIIFSFAGNITYNKPTSETFEVIRRIPVDKIMLDTDAPYLSPVPMRGQRNEPANVFYVADKILEIKGLDKAKIGDVLAQNARAFFGI
jgi:TatD DNase family protein